MESTTRGVTAESSSPLRCVHYLDAILEEAGGVVRAVLDLTAALAAAGVEVTLLTGDATDAPADWLTDNSCLPRVLEFARPDFAKQMLGGGDRKAVRSALEQADVVHLHTPWDRYNLAVAHEAKRAGVPYIVSIHGMLDDWSMTQRSVKKRSYLSLFGRPMLEGAARLHFTALGERDQAMKWAPGGAACVLPLIMDLSPYRQLPGTEIAQETFPTLQSDGAKLLFLSRVHPKKGVELLVDAVAAMRKRGDAVQALIAGPGDEAYIAELKQRAADSGVAEHVHFLGMVRGETKLSLYQACDMFVLPTSQENFGIVLTEAMACGTPTVTTRGVDIWQELEERGAVIVDRDTESIVRAIDELLSGEDELEKRATKSRTGVFEWLDPEKLIHSYVDLYRECV